MLMLFTRHPEEIAAGNASFLNLRVDTSHTLRGENRHSIGTDKAWGQKFYAAPCLSSLIYIYISLYGTTAQDLLSGLHIDLSDCLVFEMEAGHGQLLNEIMENHPGGSLLSFNAMCSLFCPT